MEKKINNDWVLFIDDERLPVDPNSRIARSSFDAICMVEDLGMPIHIDFDHDLGGDDTSMNFIKWLEDALIDEKVSFPKGFSYAIHSQNPIGKDNIKNRMDSLLKHFSK